MTTQYWVGKFAQVKKAETPGWGPEGLVTYPAGIGGFIRCADDEGRAVIELSHFYGRYNPNLATYGEVSFELDNLLLGEGIQAWGADDRKSQTE
jgi:hypothetical protein